MNPTVPQLLAQGLIITVVGMGLVFAALALLWGVIILMRAVFRDREKQSGKPLVTPIEATVTVTPRAEGELSEEERLTAERAKVAAVVAGALLSNALPMLFEVPSGPAFEHGRTAPSWVTSNRARNLRSWQPPRAKEGSTE